MLSSWGSPGGQQVFGVIKYIIKSHGDHNSIRVIIIEIKGIHNKNTTTYVIRTIGIICTRVVRVIRDHPFKTSPFSRGGGGVPIADICQC